MTPTVLDPILARMEAQATLVGMDFEDCLYVGTDGQKFPRWKLEPRWITFECGCRAERCRDFKVPVQRCDPVIFLGLPEQAVYDQPCHKHEAFVNTHRARYGGYVTFQQWKIARRHLLLGVSA